MEYDNTENEKIVIQKQFNGFYILYIFPVEKKKHKRKTIFTETIPNGEIPRVWYDFFFLCFWVKLNNSWMLEFSSWYCHHHCHFNDTGEEHFIWIFFFLFLSFMLIAIQLMIFWCLKNNIIIFVKWKLFRHAVSYRERKKPETQLMRKGYWKWVGM